MTSLLPNHETMSTDQMVSSVAEHILNRTLGPKEHAILYGAFNPQALPESDYFLDQNNSNIAAFAATLASLPEFQVT